MKSMLSSVALRENTLTIKEYITFLRLRRAYYNEYEKRARKVSDYDYGETMLKTLTSNAFLSFVDLGNNSVNVPSSINPSLSYREISDLLDSVLPFTEWFKEEKERRASDDGMIATRDESLLLDYAFYYERIESALVPSPFDDDEKKALYSTFSYPDEFFERLTVSLLQKHGAKTDEIAEFYISDASTKKARENAINTLFLPLLKRNKLDINDNIAPDGEVILKPILREDRSPDYIAAMKWFRKIRQDNAKVARLIHTVENLRRGSENGQSTEEYMKSVGLLSPKFQYKELPDIFLTLATALSSFLRMIGLPEESIEKLCVLNRLDLSSTKNKKIVQASVNKYIGGKKASENNKAIPGALCATKIPKEFTRRQTEIQKFVARFKTENAKRAQNGYKTPFSDDLILRCHDEKFLREIGMEEENIKRITKLYIPENGLDDRSREILSKAIGGNAGVRTAKAFTSKHEAEVEDVDVDSSMIDIYRRLSKESGDSYKNFTYSQCDDKYAVGYSVGLLRALFRTDLLNEIIRTSQNYSALDIARKWIILLPTNSPIIDPNKLNVSKKDILDGLEKDNSLKHTPADFIAAAFSMLVRSGCDWSNLTIKQRIEFRRTMNETIKKELFGAYKTRDNVMRTFFSKS